MATAIQTRNSFVISQYGESQDILSLAKRIKIMVPGGSKLNDSEAQGLAQVSLVTHLNCFIGEIWYIPGKGPMIGIKGARRLGNEQVTEAGGKDAYWVPDMRPCAGDEAGYKGDIKDLAAAYRCTITDSVTTEHYRKMLLETITALRAAGSKDPVGEAREICGQKPEWIGYGFATVSEQSRMNKQALAMKRAEADALKKRFYVPFGAEVAAGDDASEAEAPEWVNGTATTVQAEQEHATENTNQETGETTEAIQYFDPHGDVALKIAMEQWGGTDQTRTAQELWKLFPKGTKPMTRAEITESVISGKPA